MAVNEGYSPRNRAERIIAAGRLFLAVFLGVAVLLDPTEPSPYAKLVLRLALWYLAYATAIGILVSVRRATTAALSYGTHAVDLMVFSLLMHLTESTGSPFFVYFIFATLAGAIRWHGLGALLTGIGGLVVYLLVTLGGAVLDRSPDFEMNRFVARCTQLAIVTAFVSYLASYHYRLHREITRLAAWPRLPLPDTNALNELLAYAAEVLRVRGVVFAWEEGDEPSLRIASWQRGKVEVALEAPDAFGDLVAPPLESSAFICSKLRTNLPLVVYRTEDGYDVWRGAPLSAAFRRRFDVDSVIAVQLTAERINGWLFAIGRARTSSDDLLLAEVVARLVAGALELRTVLEQLKEAAAGEERLRLARELHDGVLQSLTAASLQAQRARHVMGNDPGEAARRLTRVEETILSAHQALRISITDLRPGSLEGARPVDCGQEVRQAATRLAQQWDIAVHLDVAPDIAPVPRRTAHELVRMVQEALANAVRHGGAREVAVSLEGVDGELRLAVDYRGRGFSGLIGRYDLAELDAMKAGPGSLKERVTMLGGSLVIDSKEDGARVEIAIPQSGLVTPLAAPQSDQHSRRAGQGLH